MDITGIPDLKQIERQVHNSLWDDGLIDLCTGIALFVMGVMWVIGSSPYSTFIAPLLVPVWISARQRLTEPRLGVVNFSTERVRANNRTLLALFALGTLSLTLGILWYFSRPETESVRAIEQINIVAGLPGFLLATPAAIIGVAFGLRRYLAYAVALLLAALPVALLDLHPGWAFIPGGILCIAIGSTLLVRFVRKYPREA